MISENKYVHEYTRWLQNVRDIEILNELNDMDENAIEDAFYRDLAFGTGGLRGTIGSGTNRMNIYVVRKASQGLADYLGPGQSVVIGYDSRIKSDVFAQEAASVFAANGIKVWFWSELTPVPTVSYAIRKLKASAGIMITASHNPSKYNGYKVYGSDGCQITTEAAKEIQSHINSLDIFSDVKQIHFDQALQQGLINYVPTSVMDSFVESVKNESVLFGDKVDKNVSIVYSPLNGTGLKPIARVLEESGYSSIIVVEEQKNPDGHFPTCLYPNPETQEAMELGLQYCKKTGADLFLATDPDCDRCGIAVRDGKDYKLLSANEVGLLLLDYICSQRTKHKMMPAHPVFCKTIVTIDLAEKIAEAYDVETMNVLTGFKFIGEIIGRLEEQGRKDDYIFGFEESYGYLTGSYVRDKDGVNAAYMICEMFAFYKTRGISLIEKLNNLYSIYGYCLNTLYTYDFPGSSGSKKMQNIMNEFHEGFDQIAGYKVIKTEDYNEGLNGLPKSNVLKYYLDTGSVVIRPSGTEPKLKVYISITAADKDEIKTIESAVASEIAAKVNRK